MMASGEGAGALRWPYGVYEKQEGGTPILSGIDLWRFCKHTS